MIFLENTYIWSARFFFLVTFFYRRSAENSVTTNLVNLCIFRTRLFKKKLNSNFFERQQIYFYRSLLQLRMQHSGKSFSWTRDLSRSWITAPRHFNFFSKTRVKLTKNDNWRENSNRRPCDTVNYWEINHHAIELHVIHTVYGPQLIISWSLNSNCPIFFYTQGQFFATWIHVRQISPNNFNVFLQDI
jgi:hypothetical protein